MTTERKLIAAAVSSALALPMAAQAVEFSVSGHVNRAVLSVDNSADDNDDLRHVDSNASQSRVRFTGSEELDSAMSVGVNLEMGILSTGASSGTTTRHAAAFLDTPGGKVTLGHTSTAADGMAHARLGGPSWLGGVTNWCSYFSQNAAGGTAVACPSNDGGRTDILRYDTPALGPATLSISAGDNDYWDLQLKIAGSFGDGGYDFRIGHIAEYETTTTTPASSSMRTVRGSTRTVEAGALFTEADAGGAPTTIAGIKTLKPEGTAYYLVATDDTSQDSLTARVPGDGGEAADATTLVGSYSPSSGNDIASNVYLEVVPDRTETTSTPAMTTTNKMGDVLTTSVAVAFGQGTSVAVAWSKDSNEPANTDHEYLYAEVDHSYGDGSVGLYWKQGERGNGAGQGSTEGSLWGVGIGHSIGAGATAYAGYRVIKEDNVSEDVSLLLAGMRVTFN